MPMCSVLTELPVFYRKEWLKQLHVHWRWQQHFVTGVDIKIYIISCLAPFSLGKIIDGQDVSSIFKRNSIIWNEQRRAVPGSHTLWGNLQRSEKMVFITGHSYVQITSLLRWYQSNKWNAKTSLVAQWAGTDAFYWDLCLYLGLSVLCPKRNNSCTYRKAVGVGSRIFLSWVREKTKNKPLVKVRENVSIFSALNYILLLIVKQSSFLFYP